MIEYSIVKTDDIMISGNRNRTSGRAFANLYASYTTRFLCPFVYLGVGSGNFKVDWNGEITEKTRTIWDMGGGLKYKILVFSARYIGPQVNLCGLPFSCFIMNDEFQLTLGLLFSI